MGHPHHSLPSGHFAQAELTQAVKYLASNKRLEIPRGWEPLPCIALQKKIVSTQLEVAKIHDVIPTVCFINMNIYIYTAVGI